MADDDQAEQETAGLEYYFGKPCATWHTENMRDHDQPNEPERAE